ncbi:MAG: glycosyltransferase family 2 protein [Alistipes sp.]|nr:glycosyltransferase family 2 protein [Alistipes sp.]
MNTQPLVSIIIPSYRQAAYIAETLDSVLAQTYASWEALIIDDGSPDNTDEIVAPYLERDSRIKYLKKANGGVSAARNYGLHHAQGEYILPLDADDVIAPRYLELAVKAFEEVPERRLIYCYARFFGARTDEFKVRYKGYRRMLLDNSIFCSAVYRRSDALAIGGYDETLHLGFEDWDFNIRFLDEESLVYQIPEELFFYRIKPSSRNADIFTENRVDMAENALFERNREKYYKAYGSIIYHMRRVEHRRRKWGWLSFKKRK